jgi:hypothetical protein
MRTIKISSTRFYKSFKLVLGIGNEKAKALSKVAASIVNDEMEQFTKDFCAELFNETKHGDQEHQDWLKNKIESFRSNLFLHSKRGGGI